MEANSKTSWYRNDEYFEEKLYIASILQEIRINNYKVSDT